MAVKNVRESRMNLDRNGFKKIPYDLPTELVVLSMTDNRLEDIDARNVENFEQMRNLREVYLSGNFFHVVYDYQLRHFTRLNILTLKDNPLVSTWSRAESSD